MPSARQPQVGHQVWAVPGHWGRSVPARAGQRGCAGMTSKELGSDAGDHTEQTGVFAREEIYPGNDPIKPQ